MEGTPDCEDGEAPSQSWELPFRQLVNTLLVPEAGWEIRLG